MTSTLNGQHISTLVLDSTIRRFGKEKQTAVAIEELSELIQELTKTLRGEDRRTRLIEELADCYIVMMQIEMMNSISQDQIQEMIDHKLDRLARRRRKLREAAVKEPAGAEVSEIRT
jgi:hypothetical protein